MEEDGAELMGRYCRDWSEPLVGAGVDREQPISIRAAGWDKDKVVSMAVSPLPASEIQAVAYSPLKLSLTLCFFRLHVGIKPCHFK